MQFAQINDRLLTDEERKLLLEADAMQYTMYRYTSLGDMHKHFDVEISEERKEDKCEIRFDKARAQKELEHVEKRLDELEKQLKDCAEENNSLLDEYRLLRNRQEEVESQLCNCSDGDTVEVSMVVMGEYIRHNPTDRPRIVLYIKNIRGNIAENPWGCVETYVHECHHCYYDTDHSILDHYIKNIEEPLAEAGMLYWLEDFDKLHSNVYLEQAKENVRRKQLSPATCSYGFGYYLFTEHHDLPWPEMMFKADKTWSNTTELTNYSDYFINGIYPYGNEQIVAENMLKILGAKRATLLKISPSSIGEYEYIFAKCPRDIKGSIVINKLTKKIGIGAFSRCKDLTSVEIPNSIVRIGESAFAGCSNLRSIRIPVSVKMIGDHCFGNCYGLVSIICEPLVPPSCGIKRSSAFEGVNKSIPLYVPATSIVAYQQADGWKDFTNIRAI